jgi:hypothetical protein
MFSRLRRILLCASVLLPGTRAQAAGWEHLGNVDRVQELKDGVELSAGKTRVRVTFFRGDIVRVRVAPNGFFRRIIPGPSSSRLSLPPSKCAIRETKFALPRATSLWL